ncbi:4Fe-4S binding protein [Collinsella tanakaei]|uniref:4Fe-4S binding protein n=1 Tax=Collinsella tanakaei TaxID=626935 RepID=UPI0025A328D5|nr:4Fe-4S binding protein [Collinsella tanakaei]MDM8300261.1 4Fe-4S binding protein [Collinsella tanakaei]
MNISACTAAYFTGAGTTRTITERFTAAIEAAGIPARAADIAPAGSDVPTFDPNDLAVFAVPSFGGRVPAPALAQFARCEGHDTPTVLIITFGNRAVDDTFLELADTVRERGFIPVALGAICAHHSLMIDVAKGRPDKTDLEAVDNLAHAVLDKLARISDARDAELADIPGNRPYRDFAGSPFRAQADAGVCTGCGSCARQCPAGAIDPANLASTDTDACITCMRCIVGCPAGARSLTGGEDLAAMRAAFAERLAPRVESYIVG